uniref:NUDIX hydrolase n=1 Tax=Roseihalotalea indica TaxID=2867963 RepID=A0AA49GU97_9BACT|nr:NUDIX hydrolase [Tunicatimonas sp. TK19036]
MNPTPERIHAQFGNQVRVRVCAICFSGDDLLLIAHRGLTEEGYFIAPPGGGIEFGESAEEALYREVEEETGLQIDKPQFLFVHEFIGPPLHAIELFFSADIRGGTLKVGTDPEMEDSGQIIERVQFMSPQEIYAEQKGQFHQIIRHCNHPKELLSLRGYFKFDNKTRN